MRISRHSHRHFCPRISPLLFGFRWPLVATLFCLQTKLQKSLSIPLFRRGYSFNIFHLLWPYQHFAASFSPRCTFFPHFMAPTSFFPLHLDVYIHSLSPLESRPLKMANGPAAAVRIFQAFSPPRPSHLLAIWLDNKSNGNAPQLSPNGLTLSYASTGEFNYFLFYAFYSFALEIPLNHNRTL
jgi:hypothetical protein